ncbi:MAG: cyclic nucleotide-binding domain-containing protein [Rhodospirillales bacterium]
MPFGACLSLKALPRASLDKLLIRAAIRTCAKGQVLFLKGDPAEYIYVILHGSLIVSCGSAEGDEGVIGIAEPGDILAQEAVFTDQIYPYCAKSPACPPFSQSQGLHPKTI